MPLEARILDVLIASPGDVASARDAIERELHDWNSSRSKAVSVVLQPRRWEIDGVPLLGRGDAQSVLNEQLVDEADIVIGVFHTRLGSPTQRAASGTAEELERSSAAGKPVHVWFSKHDIPYDVDEDQLRALRAFRRLLESQHFVGSYTTEDELRSKVRQAIDYDISQLPQSRSLFEATASRVSENSHMPKHPNVAEPTVPTRPPPASTPLRHATPGDEAAPDRESHLASLLRIHERNIRILEAQEARYAGGAPVHLLVQLEDERRLASEIRRNLGIRDEWHGNA